MPRAVCRICRNRPNSCRSPCSVTPRHAANTSSFWGETPCELMAVVALQRRSSRLRTLPGSGSRTEAAWPAPGSWTGRSGSPPGPPEYRSGCPVAAGCREAGRAGGTSSMSPLRAARVAGVARWTDSICNTSMTLHPLLHNAASAAVGALTTMTAQWIGRRLARRRHRPKAVRVILDSPGRCSAESSFPNLSLGTGAGD